MFSDLVDGNDMGMVQARSRFGFHSEALHQVGRRQGARGHHLERHKPVQGFLPRPIHDPHPAASHLTQQLVVPEEPQGRRREGCGRQTRSGPRFGKGLLRGRFGRIQRRKAQGPTEQASWAKAFG